MSAAIAQIPIVSSMTPEAALQLFRESAAVTPEELQGYWQGMGLPTGHFLDGILEDYGWYGKFFVNSETVHPLLFHGSGSQLYAINPKWLPLKLLFRFPLPLNRFSKPLFKALMPILRTTQPTARLRMVEYEDRVSAAMVYDHHPVIDHFRRLDEKTLIGLMDYRESDRPFFFQLVKSSDPSAKI